MGGQQQPYMYTPTYYDDGGSYPSSPSKPFDPKAVTRASWEPRPQKPKHEGPLVSFNQHPDSYVVPQPRKKYKIPGPRTKSWIKGLRITQLCFRVMELVAAAGILFLFIIIDDVASLTSWVLRITAGVVMLHCAYGIFHLARPAGARPPASSSGYQTFASFTDLAALPLYAYGCLSVRNSSGTWGTLLQGESLMNYFLPALFWTLFAGVVLHLISMIMGLWLALKFRQIAQLPPDLNPLEANLTSRHHKKLSVATTSTYNFEAVPMEQLRRSGMPHDGESERPPSIPFHATRSTPRSSFGSSDLPPRQYQIEPGNSPRNSITAADLNRMSGRPSSSHSNIAPTPPPRSPWRNSQIAYSEVSTSDLADFRPLHGRNSMQAPPSPGSNQGHHSRPSTSHAARNQQQLPQGHVNREPINPTQPRPAKFTEAWQATESLFNRTHAKNRATMPAGAGAGTYEAIRRRYDLSDSEESDYEDNQTETATALSVAGYSVLSPPATEIDYSDLGTAHQDPLRSNPSLPSIAGSSASSAKQGGRRARTPFVAQAAPLSEIDLNDGRVSNNNNHNNASNGAEITDEQPAPSSPKKSHLLRGASSKRHTWAPRDRNSSIQPEADFYAKPYGDLRASTPPIIVGADRQVSSGTDYNMSGMGGGQAAKRYFSFGKRNVSGKVVEEGRAVGYAH